MAGRPDRDGVESGARQQRQPAVVVTPQDEGQRPRPESRGRPASTIVEKGKRLSLGDVKVPVYNLATREDHIAPARSVFTGAQYFGGPMRYVLSGSGHIAGVVNPPAKKKYQYWTGEVPHGEDVEAWLMTATEHPGSWWPDWLAWIKAQDATEVPPRQPGGGAYQPIEDAPGSYVKVRS